MGSTGEATDQDMLVPDFSPPPSIPDFLGKVGVIVSHICHLLKNGWLKYNHRVMYKKYTSPLPYLWDVGK